MSDEIAEVENLANEIRKCIRDLNQLLDKAGKVKLYAGIEFSPVYSAAPGLPEATEMVFATMYRVL